MPLVTLKMTDEELVLLDTIVKQTFSRSRSEFIRDALMDRADHFPHLRAELADAHRARRFYQARSRKRA